MEMRNKRNLIIIHWNCNSVYNKFEEFKIFLIKYNPDIVMLNETKINDFTANNLFNQLSNYKFLHKQRSEKNGAGGVAILVKAEIQFETCNLFDNLELELIAIKIMVNKKELVVISYYNPPNCKLSEEIFNKLSQAKIPFIMMGDLNSKLKSIGCIQDNSNGSALAKIISNNDCIILENNDHTYFKFRKDKIFSDKLDLAICSSALFSKLKNLVVLKYDDMTSDHVPIQIELNTDKNEA